MFYLFTYTYVFYYLDYEDSSLESSVFYKALVKISCAVADQQEVDSVS